MLAYIVRRMLQTVPVILGVSLIVFTLFNLVGGDPVLLMVGKNAKPETMATLRAQLGLDQPLWRQFLDYLQQIVTFDFGRSTAYQEEISQMILRRIPPSLGLGVMGFFLSLLLGMALALIVSFYRGSWIDRAISFLCVMGMSISSLAFILFGQYILAYKLGWFPISGYESGVLNAIPYLFLPALIWTMVSLGPDVRFFRTAILDEVNQDYVRTARAKGLSERMIYLKHVLKNSLIPVLTYIVIEIPFLILGALLLENFFGIPGIGSMTVDAFNHGDYPVMRAMTTVISLLAIFGNLITDILYTVVDPRVKIS